MGKHDTKSREQKVKELHARFDEIALKLSRRKGNVTFSTEEIRRTIRKQGHRDKRLPEVEPIVYQRDLPRSDSPSEGVAASEGSGVPLEEVVNGTEIQSTYGRAFMISQRVNDVSGDELFSSSFSPKLCRRDSNSCRRIVSACGPVDFAPDDLIFVDIETTGLANSPLFLIGTMIQNCSTGERTLVPKLILSCTALRFLRHSKLKILLVFEQKISVDYDPSIHNIPK